MLGEEVLNSALWERLYLWPQSHPSQPSFVSHWRCRLNMAIQLVCKGLSSPVPSKAGDRGLPLTSQLVDSLRLHRWGHGRLDVQNGLTSEEAGLSVQGPGIREVHEHLAEVPENSLPALSSNTCLWPIRPGLHSFTQHPSGTQHLPSALGEIKTSLALLWSPQTSHGHPLPHLFFFPLHPCSLARASSNNSFLLDISG